MSDTHRKPSLPISIAMFVLLVAIGAVGRWGQPVWNFTPMAAVGLFAGAYYGRRDIALFVPLAAMLLSNLWLPSYRNFAVMVSVYVMMIAPAMIGPWLQRSRVKKTSAWIGRLAVGAVAPSAAFYLVTNFAEWFFTANYARTAAGLMECYAYALPFYRQMLAGDIFYVAVLFGAMALVGVASPAVQPNMAPVRAR
ncbi:MAG: DUF6580 family putative transport protein [Planctomycetota bacterium]